MDIQHIPHKAVRENVGTQVIMNNEKETISELSTKNSLDSFQVLIHKILEPVTYRNSEVMQGVNLVNINHDFVKVVWMNLKYPDMNLGVQRGFTERYANLTKINKNFENIVLMTKSNSDIFSSLRIRKKKQHETEERAPYALIVDGKGSYCSQNSQAIYQRR